MSRPTTEWQRGLQHFNGHLFVPDGATTGGRGLGAAWTTGAVGTLSHAAPGTAFDTQFKRTVWTEAGASNNQELGPRQSLTSEYNYYLGNAANLGGWYMSAILRVDAWDTPAAPAGRIFVGLTASANPVCISDTFPANTIGLSHLAADTQDVLNLVMIDSTGAALTGTPKAVTTNALNPNILAAGNTFLWEMWSFPNQPTVGSVEAKLSWFDATNHRVSKLKWTSSGTSASGHSISPTAMMAPQCQMSNGTDATAGHYAISVANVYVNTWTGEQD